MIQVNPVPAFPELEWFDLQSSDFTKRESDTHINYMRYLTLLQNRVYVMDFTHLYANESVLSLLKGG